MKTVFVVVSGTYCVFEGVFLTRESAIEFIAKTPHLNLIDLADEAKSCYDCYICEHSPK